MEKEQEQNPSNEHASSDAEMDNNNPKVESETKVESEMEVIQVAYIFGGATLGAHIVDVSNADYVSAKDEKMTVFTIAMDF